MNNVVKETFKLKKSDVDSFQKKGFIVLKNFLTDFFIEKAYNIVNAQIEKPSTNYGNTFNKLKYDIGNDNEFILNLIQNETFQKTLLSLTKKHLLFTQGLSFELEKNKDKGFPWHVGTVSFACHKKEEAGFTMWIPFCKINPNEQRGGMKLIPQNIFSGEFIFQYIELLPQFLKKKIDKNKEQIDFNYFYELKNHMLNNKWTAELLDFYAEEPEMNPGDVILFNKNILHRSVPLLEGEIQSRIALALRFIEIDSTYDYNRVYNQEFLKNAFNYSGSSNFSKDLNLKHNELITQSSLFKNLSQRIIGYEFN